MTFLTDILECTAEGAVEGIFYGIFHGIFLWHWRRSDDCTGNNNKHCTNNERGINTWLYNKAPPKETDVLPLKRCMQR
jgi:hypothetical protein